MQPVNDVREVEAVELEIAHPEPSRNRNSSSVKQAGGVASWATRLLPIGYSFADQVFAVGATFLANVMLARTQTKEQYGIFALSYSIFTFLSAVHNSIVVEPYMVYGAGRYRGRLSEYLRLMIKANAVFGLALTSLLIAVCLVLRWILPEVVSPTLWGLGITVGI